MREGLARAAPLGRMGRAEEVAATILYPRKRRVRLHYGKRDRRRRGADGAMTPPPFSLCGRRWTRRKARPDEGLETRLTAPPLPARGEGRPGGRHSRAQISGFQSLAAAISAPCGGRRFERKRDVRRHGGPAPRVAGVPRGGETVIAVELPDDFDDAVDCLEVGARHRAVGDQQRLVQTADLDGEELGRRLRHAPGEDFLHQRPHPFASVTPSRDAISATETPLFSIATICCSRLIFSSRAARLALIDRLRRGAGTVTSGGTDTGFLLKDRGNKDSTNFCLSQEKCRVS